MVATVTISFKSSLISGIQLKMWWLWLTAYETPKFKIRILWKGFHSCKP